MPALAMRTVKTMAKLTQMNHLLSVQPPRVLRMRIEESVPEVDEVREKRACSALPHMYYNEKKKKEVVII